MLNQAFLYCCRLSLSSAVIVMREEDVVPSNTDTLEEEEVMQNGTERGSSARGRRVCNINIEHCVYIHMT